MKPAAGTHEFFAAMRMGRPSVGVARMIQRAGTLPARMAKPRFGQCLLGLARMARMNSGNLCGRKTSKGECGLSVDPRIDNNRELMRSMRAKPHCPQGAVVCWVWPREEGVVGSGAMSTQTTASVLREGPRLSAARCARARDRGLLFRVPHPRCQCSSPLNAGRTIDDRFNSHGDRRARAVLEHRASAWCMA